MEGPVAIEEDIYDSDFAHALWPVPEKGYRISRIIYNENIDPVAVVAAFFDSQAKTS